MKGLRTHHICSILIYQRVCCCYRELVSLIIRIKMSKRRLKNEEDDEQKEESEPEMFELDKLTDAQIKNAGKLPS